MEEGTERRETLLQTPVERAIQNARTALASLKEDLIKAGVTTTQIENAGRNAELRIQGEYAEKEKQDPLTRLKMALDSACQTEEDKQIASYNKQWIEQERRRLQDYVLNPIEIEKGHQADWRGTNKEFKRDVRVRISILEALRLSKENIIHPSPEFMERVLKALGALDATKSLQDIYDSHYPNWDPNNTYNQPQPTTPIREKDQFGVNWISRIPTDIQGIDIRITSGRIQASISLDTLSKIQPPN